MRWKENREDSERMDGKMEMRNKLTEGGENISMAKRTKNPFHYSE